METLKPLTTIRIALLCLLFIPFIASSQTVTEYNSSGTYTLTVPAGVTSVDVLAWGAGGGAANGDADKDGIGGGGGAGGGFIGGTLAVSEGDVITVYVGAGGAGGSGTQWEDGSAGENTTITVNGIVVTAAGGGPGLGVSHVGGSAGTNSVTGGTLSNQVSYVGGDGGDAIHHTGGGGGGSAGTEEDGEDGEDGDGGGDGDGGDGGDDDGGDGGDGTHKNERGEDGESPGGGGGGAGHDNTDGGGDGADGKVIISYMATITSASDVNFDGDDDYITVNESLVSGLEELTMMAWVKIADGASGDLWIMGEDVVEFKIENNGKLSAKFKTEDKDVSVHSIGNVFEDEIWYHVAVSYNANEDHVGLYINGIDHAQVIQNANKSDEIEESGTDFEIGREADEDDNYFEGSICEIKVFDKSLTAEEVQSQVYQRIQNVSENIHGVEINEAISDLKWEDLSLYLGLIEDEEGNFDVADTSENSRIITLENMNASQDSNAPLPIIANGSGVWATSGTWKHGDVWDVEELEETQPWAIVELTDNVDLTSGSVDIALMGLTVPENSSFTMEGSTDINSGTGTGNSLTVSQYLLLNGVLDLEGESQLFQDTDANNIIGENGYLERDQQGTLDTYTYNYWSSPVSENGSNYRLGTVLSEIDFVGGYNGSTAPLAIAEYWIWRFTNSTSNDYSQWLHTKSTGQISIGEGFTMKGPGTGISDFQNYVFRGEPNNGTFTLAINAGNDYLVGNPYPSAIDADQFILDNEAVLKDEFGTGGALLFWEHWGGGSHVLKEYEGGYAYYTLSGGVEAPSHAEVSQNGEGTKTPGATIPVGQGFFVTAEADGNIEFNNGQRVFAREANTSSIFMKSAEQAPNGLVENIEDPRMKIRLGVDMPKGYHRQILMTVDERSTSGVDYGFDAVLSDELHNDMFWVMNDKKFIVQAVPELNKESEISFGFEMKSAGTMKIGIDQLENVYDDFELFIKDKTTGETYKISATDSFEIDLEEGSYLDKYAVVFQPRLQTLAESSLDEGFTVFMNNETEHLQIIKTVDADIDSVLMFNALGQQIYSWNPEVQSREYEMYFNQSTGVYFVQVMTNAGEIKKKILVN